METYLTLKTLLILCPFLLLGGFVDAIAGGGGLITLPAYLIAGIPPHAAIATNKLSNCIGSSFATGRFIRSGYVDWKLTLPCVAAAVAGALLGSSLSVMADEVYLRYLLLAVLPIAAFFVLRKHDWSAASAAPASKMRQFVVCTLSTLLLCVYDGFYGPGTGTFLLLCYVQLAGVPLLNASGQMKVAGLSSNLGSLVVFLAKGQTLVLLGLIASIFTLVGNLLGAGLAIKNGQRLVQPIVLVVLALLFVRVLSELLA